MPPAGRRLRKETPHFRRFRYAEIVARDKANLDFQWQAEAMNSNGGETPRALMKEILKDLEEAMREFVVFAGGSDLIRELRFTPSARRRRMVSPVPLGSFRSRPLVQVHAKSRLVR